MSNLVYNFLFYILTYLIKLIRKITYATIRISFSQSSEDIIVQNIFRLKGINKPSYLDIGCNDPFYISNTALFHLNGSQGINIDANPILIEKFNRFRPNAININIGISHQEAEQDFYVMKDNTLSTFSTEEYEKMKLAGKEIHEIKKIKLQSIQSILTKYNAGFFPDFLSLDVEGFDLQILKSIDFSISFPKVICVEAAEFSPFGMGKRKTEIIDFLIEKGYFEFANTNLNAIMVKNEFWFR